MQGAYAAFVESTSIRRQRRREKLREIVAGYEGGATALAAAAGTPKSHISALLAGRRGVGDALAEKLERAAGRPPGWMDEPPLMMEVSDDERELLLAWREKRASKPRTLADLPRLPAGVVLIPERRQRAGKEVTNYPNDRRRFTPPVEEQRDDSSTQAEPGKTPR